MRSESRRLISLNLALLLLLTAVCPGLTPEARAAEDDYTIDGAVCSGDSAGEGWSYANNVLTLEDYDGGAIVFPGSLTVEVRGTCTVTAAEGPGISGNLVELKFLPGGSLTVYGGDGAPAVEAVKNWLGVRLPGVFTAVSGGDGVPALRAGTSVKVGDVYGKLGTTALLETGPSPDGLTAVDSYGGEPCLRAECRQVTLRFDPSGGTVNGSTAVTETVLPYDVLTDFLPTAQREGYYLRGWRANSQSWYQNSCFLPTDMTVTFTALWSALPAGDYVLLNNGYAAASTLSFRADGTVSLPGAPAVEGMTFLGWGTTPVETAADRVTGLYWPGPATLPSGTVLYAVYGQGTDYVLYDGNGGEERASGGSRTAVRSETVPGVEELFLWQDHRPLSWNEQPDGSGDTVSAGDDPAPYCGEVLYAQWLTLYGRTVVYHGNGGVTEDGKTELSAPAGAADLGDRGFRRTGKVFCGWSLTPEGEALTALPDIAEGETLELYALWDGFTVTCHGTKWVPYELQETTYVLSALPGDSVYLPHQSNDSRRGLYFNGWNTEPDGSGVWYQNRPQGPFEAEGSYYQAYYTFTPTEDVTLYAQYADLSGSEDALLFVSEGYFGGRNYLAVPTEDGAVTLPETLEDYTLLGWVDNDDFGSYQGPAWLAGDTVEDAAGRVFLAVCREQTFTRNWFNHYVLYDGGGGTTEDGVPTVFLTVSSQDLTDFGWSLYGPERDKEQNVWANPFVKDGCVLEGWSTEPEGGTVYAPGTPFREYYSPGVYGYVFHAQWAPAADTVVLVPEELRKEGRLLLACYDGAGRLLAVREGPQGWAFLLPEGFPEGTARWRMFLLDETGVPLAEAAEGTVA